MPKFTPQVTEINVYPIKSCGRISRDSGMVVERGLAGDRRYLLVDENGEFLTQRRHPTMALIQVIDEVNGYRLEAPGQPSLKLPHVWQGGDERRVTIWRTTVEATAVADDIGEWFTRFLGFPCALVYMGPDQHRAVPNAAAKFDDEVSFADAAPLLLTTEASLEDLNARLAAPVSMRRFRPNIVVTADLPFAEDGWRYLRVGEAEFEVAWPSARCVLTTVDPDTGIKDARGDPLRTLRGFRRTSAGIMFGQNLIPRRLGRISVGDLVEVD